MKKLVFMLIGLLMSFFVNAQPTSIAGITPGETTLEELRTLVKEEITIDKDGNAFFFYGGTLSQLDSYATIRLHNKIVYEVRIELLSNGKMFDALIQKYGMPNRKIGQIGTVTCSNKFGASGEYFSGEEASLWPVRNGIQAMIRSQAGECNNFIFKTYILRHVKTFSDIEEERARNKQQKKQEAIDKIKGAL